MARDDSSWYRNPRWDPAEQALFWKKLKAARRTKGWAATGKAGQLWATGEPALRMAARDLLAQAATLGVKSQLQQARFDLDEGRLGPAEALFRKAYLEARARGESSAGHGLSLAKVLVRSPDPAHQREARKLFRAWHRGDSDLLGPWPKVAARQPHFDDFSTLAEAFVASYRKRAPDLARVLARQDVAAIQALDEATRAQSYEPLLLGLETPLAPYPAQLAALGAYLGVVLVGQYGGQWKSRKPSLLSTVKVGRQELEPHQHAREVVLYERLPGELFAGLVPRP